MSFYSRYKASLIIAGILILFVICASITYLVLSKTYKDPNTQLNSTSEQSTDTENQTYDSPAIQAGMLLSGNNCEGEGPIEITHSPMKEEDFAYIIPYGMMVGAHVTPIDHQYFSPTIFNSPRDTYEVRAVADGTITEIQSRGYTPNGDSDMSEIEYRIVFTHTCTFLTYFDLVTSLTPEIEEVFNAKGNGNYAPDMDFEVKAGDLIGYIGGRTLDFAVWDTEKPLSGFVVPEHYDVEPWKLYTADPYDYYSPELKEMLTEKNLRTAEPIAGKIDYDVDGKLIGTWFLEGTNGYTGTGNGQYYQGHLSIVPHHIDPTGIVVSIGDFEGEPKQFTIQQDSPYPAEIDQSSGLIKYDLMDWMYILPNGSQWDGMSVVEGITFLPATQNNGCLLVQLVDDRELKVELFTGTSCSTIDGFGSNSKVYER